ncbi:expressed unknown protein [Seminavis robusta]|uniref:Uncharacterized protein n=1 Tax=Seminavis robusta TaxID=568900 RepID=A0A9N8E6B8_9STRA|nr:expressed unknown protein [Seminavis robusta]|eukprot:Sro709_g190860.1 n/a (336) ;mRNA; f:26260-27421
MKTFATALVVLLLLDLASARFEGTKDDFFEIIANGEVPSGILDDEDELGRTTNFRKLQGQARESGQRCGRNNPCLDGLECTSTAFGSYCTSTACFMKVVNNFIERHQLQDMPERYMEQTGFMGRDVTNSSVTGQSGWRAFAASSEAVLNRDFRDAITDAMTANPPNMTELLLDYVTACPNVASIQGVTIMLGLHYEISVVVPKMFNNYYFAIGTGDLNLDITFDNATLTGAVNYNGTGGVFTDLCFGVGPDVGFDVGITAGLLPRSGTINDLTDCSFMFDADIAAATGFGLAIGVTSNTCTAKVMMTLGAGLGGGIGFTGCNTFELGRLSFSGGV